MEQLLQYLLLDAALLALPRSVSCLFRGLIEQRLTMLCYECARVHSCKGQDLHRYQAQRSVGILSLTIRPELESMLALSSRIEHMKGLTSCTNQLCSVPTLSCHRRRK